MSLLRPAIRDHRGRAVELCPPAAIPRGSGGWVTLHLLPLIWIPLCAAGVVGMALFGRVRLAQPLWAGAAIALPMVSGVLLACVALLVIRKPLARLTAASILAENCCPGCGYGIASLREEPDGCRVCPECGGAWRNVGSRPSRVPNLLRPLVFPLARDARGAVRGVVPHTTLSRGRARHMISMASQSGAAFWMLLFLSVLYSVLLAIDTNRHTADNLLWSFLGVSLYWLLAAGFLAGRWLFLRRGVRQLLRDRLCPACTYRLSGIFPAEDGCTVCPECGAAWRVPKNETGRT